MKNITGLRRGKGIRGSIFSIFAVTALIISGFFVAGDVSATISTINLISPDSAGLKWNGSHSITWSGTSDNPADTVDITYAADGTNFNQLVAADVPFSDFSYPWDTTAFTETLTGRIKISPSGFPLLGDSSTNIFEIDNTPPTILSVTTYDDNGVPDGNVDRARIVFNEPVRDFSFAASDFTIDGQAGATIESTNGGSTVDDDTFDVLFATVTGTGVKDLTYTATAGSGTDMADPGNLLATVTVTATDGAAPVLISARTTTTTTIDATFSEDLDGSTVFPVDFSVTGGHNVLTASETLAGVITLGLDSAMTTDETPTVTYTAGSLTDLPPASNLALTGFVVSTDGVAPTLSLVGIDSDNITTPHLFAKVGDTITVSFTSSEVIDTPTITIDGHSATVTDLGGNNWKGDYLLVGGETEGLAAFTIDFTDSSPAHNPGVQVTAVDDASSVTIDETNPSATITAPVVDQVITANNVNAIFTVTDINAVTCAYTVSADGLAGAIPCAGGNISVFTDGRRLLTLNATDAAGNIGSDDVSFVINLDGKLTVDWAGGADFTMIQPAVDRATSGDEIDIAGPHDYGENVIIGAKTLTLVGTGDPTTTSLTLNSGAVVTGSSGITAPTVNVNSGALIADGVLLGQNSGLLNIGAGTFSTNFTVNKSLDVECAPGGATTQTLGVVVNADNVTINGCKFSGNIGSDAFINLDNDNAHSGISLTNNIFDGAITTWHLIRAGGNKTNLTITGNTFTGSTSGNDNAMILLGMGGDNINVSDNIFNLIPSLYNPVAIQHNANGGVRTTNLTIDSNIINFTGYIDTVGNGAEAISVRYADHVVVTNNILTGSADSSTYEAGITLASVTSTGGQSEISGNTADGFSRSIRMQRWNAGDLDSDNVVIYNNTITNAKVTTGWGGSGSGFYLAAATNLSIYNNSVSDSEDVGIFIPDLTGDNGANNLSGLVIGGSAGTFNKIYDNVVGVNNLLTSIASADYNWWGDPTGPYHSPENTLGAGNAVSDYVDYSPWCLDDTCSDFGSSDPLHHYDVTPDSISPIAGTLDNFTITAKDAADIKRVNDTSTVTIAVDNGAAINSPLTTLSGGDNANPDPDNWVSKSVAGTVNVLVVELGGVPHGSSIIGFIGSDLVAPTLDSHTPDDDATGVAINIAPYLIFSEPLDSTTVNSTNIGLRKYDDESVIAATVSLVEGSTKVIITPNAPLSYETQYYFVVSMGVKDLAGNTFAVALDNITKDSHEFTTEINPADTTPPTITLTSVIPSQTAADVTFHSNEDGTGWIRYGLGTGYGNQTDIVSLTAGVDQTFTLTGLTCDTTYHYKPSAQDMADNESFLADTTFSTVACTPAPDTIPPAINSISLDKPAYHLTQDPDVAVTVVEDNTADIVTINGDSATESPDGTWTSSFAHGQTAPGTYSFNVVATDSVGNVTTQIVYYSVIEDNAAPAPEVTITNPAPGDEIGGDSYEVDVLTNGADTTNAYISIDGADWVTVDSNGNPGTFTLDTTGLVDGSHTVRAKDTVDGTTGYSDYITFIVHNAPADTTPPVITNIQATSITETSATITWNTDENATSRVEFGLTSEYGTQTDPDPTADNTNHSVLISGLTAGTTYHFRVLSDDAESNPGVSGDNTFTTTAPAPDAEEPPAPEIENSSETLNSDFYLLYGTADADTPNDGQRIITVYNDGDVAGNVTLTIGQTDWAVVVSLNQDSDNEFTATSTDGSGNVSDESDSVTITEDGTFGADVDAPDAPTFSTTDATTVANTFILEGSAPDDGATRIVTIHRGSSVIAGTVIVPAGETLWSVVVGLETDTVNEFSATSTDLSGNVSDLSDVVEITNNAGTDVIPPVISDIHTGTINQTSTTANWDTDESSDSQVEYGLTSSYGSTTSLTSTLVTGHTKTLSPLIPGTLYHYRVKSRDAAGNLAISGDNVFTTAASTADVTAPIITNIQVTNIASVSATIIWTTDEASDSQVEFGPTSGYGFSTILDPTSVTPHSVDLSDLIPGITYHFRVKSADAAANPAVSGDQTFNTAPASNPPVVPGVTNITAVKTFAIADDTFGNGWEWVFDVTLPVDEASVSMKFADWVSGSNTILVAGNVRFFSEQASDANSEGTAILIGAANAYSGPMNLNADLDLSRVGRQVQIHVQAKVPGGSAAGSYSTSYGIKSATP